MTNSTRIIELLSRRPGLDDDEISVQTGIRPRQQVNQICNRLANRGVLRRSQGSNGKITNTLLSSRPDHEVAMNERASRRPPESPTVRTRSGGIAERSLVPSLLNSTLIIIPCSSAKDQYSETRKREESVLDSLPADLADELRDARSRVRARASVDENTLVPAWMRYRGHLYRGAATQLRKAVANGMRILIISGGYGVVLASEPIGYYEARFDPKWWPRGLLQRVLASYATANAVTAVRAFASATTSYRGLIEATNWSTVTRDAALLMPVSVGRGAMQNVPRAQGEALAALLEGSLHTGWTSSDGLHLEAQDLTT